MLVLTPLELVLIPVLADVEMVWMPAELVEIPLLADVEMVWIPAELTATPDLFVLMLRMLMLIDEVFIDMFVEI